MTAPGPTVHLWGIYDGDTQRSVDGVAVCEGSVFETYETVVANITHHGGDIIGHSTTRLLGGWLIGVEFESPARADGRAARMWHRIVRATDPWPAPEPRIWNHEHGDPRCPDCHPESPPALLPDPVIPST